jgi:hypothetical protein
MWGWILGGLFMSLAVAIIAGMFIRSGIDDDHDWEDKS